MAASLLRSMLSLSLALAFCSATAAAQPGVLPKDLQKVATRLNCQPVPDFYSEPGMIDPPYTYGVLEGAEESSAAFWCVRPSALSPRLVIVRGDSVVRDFEWMNPAHGLRVVYLESVNLAMYRRVDAPAIVAVARTVTRVRAIRAAEGGIETYFVEVDGVWYYTIYH